MTDPIKKIYVSGKVTGLGRAVVAEKFRRAEKAVERRGHIAVIPVWHCKRSWSWAHCMRVCLRLLTECDMVLLLPDWEQSRGAKLEVQVAQALGMPLIDYKKFVQNGTLDQDTERPKGLKGFLTRCLGRGSRR